MRAGGVPTTVHGLGGGGGTIYERSLEGTGTEYGNWVPINGRYENQLASGPCNLAMRASGGSNCRYRLRLSTGTVCSFFP